MNHLYVVDTVTFINYYNDFFNEESRISSSTRKLLDKCFDYFDSEYKLIIPSIVFVELYDKFLKSEEKAFEFKYEIFNPIKENIDIQIRSIDQELMECFINIQIAKVKLELHDKIVLSTALILNCPIITCDNKIIEFLNNTDKTIRHFF